MKNCVDLSGTYWTGGEMEYLLVLEQKGCDSLILSAYAKRPDGKDWGTCKRMLVDGKPRAVREGCVQPADSTVGCPSGSCTVKADFVSDGLDETWSYMRKGKTKKEETIVHYSLDKDGNLAVRQGGFNVKGIWRYSEIWERRK